MESGSDDYSDEDKVAHLASSTSKAKGSKKGKDKEPVKRRSSKACDNCRKSKCKCARILDPITGKPVGACENCLAAGTECKFEGATRKRGPPKGYIEAIETRLHRMEALLGGILGNDDPRAQALLGELIGDEEAKEVFARDLHKPSSVTSTGAPKRSWQESLPSPHQQAPISLAGFPPSSSSSTLPPLSSSTPKWFSEEDLGFGSSSNNNTDPLSSFLSPSNLSQNTGIDIPVSSLPLSVPRTSSTSPPNLSTSQKATQQRRKLNTAPSTSATSPSATSPFSFQTQNKMPLPPNRVNHTGQAVYSLSEEAASPANSGGSGQAGSQGGEEMTELADVVGQLSLNENAEVRYHGRSSGLYLISKSSRYKDFFWRFPSVGVQPPSHKPSPKSDIEILTGSPTPSTIELDALLPDRQTQQKLLDLYWSYVHPHFPILYKVSFLRQYRHSLDNPNSTEPSTPSGSGKVPVILLLAIFALASRFSNLDKEANLMEKGGYWTSGQGYLDKCKKLLNNDYESSKLVTVQVLLLLAYREIGTGAMSASWLFTGMAIRMAQDLGLFRDVEKWVMPVQRFSHEEKQTRKRAWWGCIILDRYTASYIGRPGTIHERDYDTSFPSEDEPDEHEQWRPLRLDGTSWTISPSSPTESGEEEISSKLQLKHYPPTKAHTMICFNAAGALAVIVNRIIANIYAIRIRVLGQSSETLLSLLDQSLASWYLTLPAQLAYNPAGKKIPPPHVLALHLQFYSALILLHRPFIPGQSSESSATPFPSHAICTTSANAIANIITVFSKTFTLRQCPPFLTYPIFSAAVICVYNAGFDEGLAGPAKVALWQCMRALKEMEVIWGSAARQYELLEGLVDLRDSDLSAQLQSITPDTVIEPTVRGTKRPAADFDKLPSASHSVPHANFHKNPIGRPTPPSSSRSSGKQTPTFPEGSTSTLPKIEPSLVESILAAAVPTPDITSSTNPNESIFSYPPFSAVPANEFGLEGGNHHQSYDILGGGNEEFMRQFGGMNAGSANFSDLLSAYLPPTEVAGQAARNDQATEEHTDYDMAFFGMPLGSTMSDDWANYLPQAFFPQVQGEEGDSSMGF